MAKAKSTCRRCGGKIEYVDVKDPYWRHVGVPDKPHGAEPK